MNIDLDEDIIKDDLVEGGPQNTSLMGRDAPIY